MNLSSLFAALLWLLSPFTPQSPALSQGDKLLAEGDQLADQKQYTEALLRYKQAYEKILPEVRGLQFTEPVDPKFMDRKDLQAHMRKLLDEDVSPQEMALADASLKVFGFVPLDFKTEETMLNLFSEEVAGFYDPKRKQMFLIKESPNPNQGGFIARLFGGQAGFNKDENKTTLAHEMAHALDDQHFDLQKLTEAAEKDDDRSLALQALVEGEATLVMMAEMQRESGGDAKDMLNESPAAMDFSFGIMQGLMPFVSGKTFRNAPPIFRETMMFGYLKGMVFVLHLTNRDEWKSVNEAFRSPPLSTEHILHPEKYLEKTDPPIAIELPSVADALGSDWKEIGQNVLGELQISIMLKPYWGQTAAAGWGGDRYIIFQGPEKKLGLAWYTTWDTIKDAEEFSGAYARYVSDRVGATEPKPASKDEPNPPKVDQQVRLERDGVVYQLVRRDKDVIVVQGLPDALTDKVQRLIEKSEKSEKK